MTLVSSPGLADLDERSREIFRLIVDAYLDTGEPVGSRTLSRRLGAPLSAATIRNVMADLQDLGLLYAPHTSAGRMPTDTGLRLFVDGIMKTGGLSPTEQSDIDALCAGADTNIERALEHASRMLAGLSQHAGLVATPKVVRRLSHIEFVHLGDGRALAVLVDITGQVENRMLSLPPGMPADALQRASNYLQSRLIGRTLTDAVDDIGAELESHRAQIDALARSVVEAGLAVWTGGSTAEGRLIVTGRSRLLGDVHAVEDLERLRTLFDALETRENVLRIVQAAEAGEGVQIFIGSENTIFDQTGMSMVVSPYRDGSERVVGAIGVLGPARLNYARIVPMVDYTARVVERLLSPERGQLG